MSTQPFGQQPVFGAAPSGQTGHPAPDDEPVAARSRRTVVIAVAAGVAALAVLGGAAALVLPGSGDEVVDTALPPAAVVPVEPSATPSTVASPLPTAMVLGRNVFAPLVDDTAAAAAAADPVAEPVETTPTTSPTSAPVYSAPVSGSGSGFGGGSSFPLPAPTVTVTETVPGPTTTVPGPTVTSEPEVVEVTVPGFHSLAVTVEEHLVEGETRYLADFWLAAEEGEEPAKYEDQDFGDDFGPKNRFVYLAYSPDTEKLSFRYVGSVFTITVPLTTPDTVTDAPPG